MSNTFAAHYQFEPLEPRRLLAGIGVQSAFGVQGSVIDDYAPTGIVHDWASEAAVQADGKLVVLSNSYAHWSVARYDTDGTRDETFGADGVVQSNHPQSVGAGALAVMPGGKIVVAGYAWESQYVARPVLARYDASGALDPTFGAGGIVTLEDGKIFDLVRLPDGKLLAGGRAGTDGWSSHAALWRLEADGSPDETFGAGGRRTYDQRVYSQGFDQFHLLSDGRVGALGGGGLIAIDASSGQVTTLAQQAPNWAPAPGGKVVVVTEPSQGIVRVARYHEDATPDDTFGTGGSVELPGAPGVRHVLVQDDGRIILGGAKRTDATYGDFTLTRLLGDGSLDSTFGFGGTLVDPVTTPAATAYDDSLRRLVLAPQGRLYAVGTTMAPAPQDAGVSGWSDNVAVRGYVLDPLVHVNDGGPYAATEGSPFTVSAAGSSYAGGSIVKYEWRYGDPQSLYMSPAAPQGETAQLTAADSPSGTVSVRVTTSDGIQVTQTTSVAVANVPPTVDAGPARVAAAGAPVTFNITVSDLVRESFSGSIDYGDGTAPQSFNSNFDLTRSFQLSHTYAAAGTYTVSVTANDGDGGTGTDTTSVEVGRIVARVIGDTSGDGAIGAGETGRAGDTVYLDLDSDGALDAGEPTAVTDALGDAVFSSVAPGTYAVRVVVPDGWQISTPNAGFLTATTGAASAAGTIALTQRSFVRGHVFNDANANGVRDPGEAPITQVQAISARTLDGSRHFGGGTGVAADGSYVLKGLPPGTHLVYIMFASGQQHQTFPYARAMHVVTVGQAEVVSGIDFGAWQGTGGTISGTVYNDWNENGVRDAGEPAPAGKRQLYLDANGNGQRDPQEYAIDATGAYAITLAPGAYTLRQVLPAGWRQTQPAPGEGHAVTLAAATTTHNVNFGSSGVETFYVRRIGNFVQAWRGSSQSGVPFLSYNFDSTGPMVITGGGGNDRLIVDWQHGVPVPTGGLTFNSGAGAGDVLEFRGTAGDDAVTVGASSAAITAPVTFDSVATVVYASGGGQDAVTVEPGGHVTFESPQRLQALAVADGASAVLARGLAGAVVTRSLSLTGAARLDLNDNDLLLDYDADAGASPLGSWNGSGYTGVAGMIQSGRNEGSWNGAGIITSLTDALALRTGIGVAEASQLLGLDPDETAVWNGVTVDATTVLLKYTYLGDVDLNGRLDADDYFYIDQHINQSGSVFGFHNGDVDLNGFIDGDDYFYIDQHISNQDVIY